MTGTDSLASGTVTVRVIPPVGVAFDLGEQKARLWPVLAEVGELRAALDFAGGFAGGATFEASTDGHLVAEVKLPDPRLFLAAGAAVVDPAVAVGQEAPLGLEWRGLFEWVKQHPRAALQRLAREWTELQHAAERRRADPTTAERGALLPDAFDSFGNIEQSPLLVPMSPMPALHLTRPRRLLYTAWSIHRLVLYDALGRAYAHGLVPLSHPTPTVSFVGSPRVRGGPWSLGAPPSSGDPYIPRIELHARKQRTTSLVMWEVDTGRTRHARLGAGWSRGSFGWDVVFGRAMVRTDPPMSPKERLANSGTSVPLGDFDQSLHIVDKLRSTRQADSWVPWVLSFGRSVGIPRLRIVDTIDGPGPVAFSSLDAMQQDVLASWRKRQVRPGTDPWSLSAPALLDRLLNGMCPHRPWLETRTSKGPPEPNSTNPFPDRRTVSCPGDEPRQAQRPAETDSGTPPARTAPAAPTVEREWGRLVWTFTWTGDGATPRFEQDGITHYGRSPLVTELARMPDITVYSSWMVRNGAKGPADPMLLPVEDTVATIERIVLEWPEVRRPGLDGQPEVIHAATKVDEHNPGPMENTHTVRKPTASEFTTKWSYAKWFVRQALLLSGQLDWHLARGHIFVEQLAADLCGELRGLHDPNGGPPVDHPFLAKLWPFLRTADEINAFGDLTLLTPRGIPAAGSCLSFPSVVARMRMMRASWHWRRDLSAMRPDNGRSLTPDDHFAAWARAAWEACHEWSKGAITAGDVSDLVFQENSPNGQPRRDAVLAALRTTQRAHAASAADQPHWWSGTGDPPLGMNAAADVSVDFTSLETLSDWRAFAAHLVFTITFVHSWVGSAQLDDMGNVFVASLGHLWPTMPGTSSTPADDWATQGPPVEHAGFGVALAELIGRHGWGRMTQVTNEVEPFETSSGQVTPVDEASAVSALVAEYQRALSNNPPPGFCLELLRTRVNI